MLEEARGKVQKAMANLSRAEEAGKALEWFARYATADTPPEDVLDLQAAVTASSTTNVGKAKKYIQKALDESNSLILSRAIELAEEDFKEALALTEN